MHRPIFSNLFSKQTKTTEIKAESKLFFKLDETDLRLDMIFKQYFQGKCLTKIESKF